MGGGPCAEDVYAGTEKVNYQVGRGPRAGAGSGVMSRLDLGTSGWDEGDVSRDRGQGGG